MPNVLIITWLHVALCCRVNVEEYYFLLHTGSTNELKTVLKDFAGNLEQKEVEVRGLETSEDKIKHKILQISDDKSELLMTQGKLEEEAEVQTGPCACLVITCDLNNLI